MHRNMLVDNLRVFLAYQPYVASTSHTWCTHHQPTFHGIFLFSATIVISIIIPKPKEKKRHTNRISTQTKTSFAKIIKWSYCFSLLVSVHSPSNRVLEFPTATHLVVTSSYVAPKMPPSSNVQHMSPRRHFIIRLGFYDSNSNGQLSLSPIRSIGGIFHDRSKTHALVFTAQIKPKSLSSWWLNQPIWRICSSNWESSPQISGWK